MQNPIGRREFLQAASLAVAGSACGEAVAKVVEQPGAAAGRARLFVGCCAYSYRQDLEKGRVTMEEFILKGVELGGHGVETPPDWLKPTEPAYLASRGH